MGFKEFKEQAKPAQLDRATLAETKQAFCIVGEPKRHESDYKGQAQIQFLSDIICLDESNRRQSTNVFLPGNKFFQNFMEGLKDHPEYKHNLYLCMDGKAYDIDQYTGICPCKHGTSDKVSRETQADSVEVEADFYAPDGTPLNFSSVPGSVTPAQIAEMFNKALPLAKLGVTLPTPEELSVMSEKKASELLEQYTMIAFGLSKASK